jgi:inward rectifier potassium channel
MADPKKNADNRSYQIRVVGAPRQPFRDLYIAYLKMSWGWAIAALVGVYLAENLAFAAAYAVAGGVKGAAAGSVVDGFLFSVQTMGTIGYGAMYPDSGYAHALVVAESVVGLVTVAIATGLLFAKFSLPTGRMVFTHKAVICPMDGVPTLMFRLGNERANQIIEATIRLVFVKTIKTAEGNTFYRMIDLAPARDRSPAISRSWTVMHELKPESPLYGYTPERLAAEEAELIVTIAGVDDTSLQPVYARYVYEHRDIAWGARLADILSEDERGDLVLDLRRFQELAPTAPTADFPYPRAGGEA